MTGARTDLECVLFDLDGTLADSRELVVAAYRHTARVYLGKPIPDSDEEVQAFLTRRFVETLAMHVPPEQHAAFSQTYNTWYEQARPGLIRLYPGVMEMLETLKQRGYRLGVVTNKERMRAVPDMEFLGVAPLMDVIITTEDTPRRKPDPQPILLALQRLEVPPQRACYVGDNPVDVQAGRAAGALTVAALWGIYPEEHLLAEQPDLALRNAGELLALCPDRTRAR